MTISFSVINNQRSSNHDKKIPNSHRFRPLEQRPLQQIPAGTRRQLPLDLLQAALSISRSLESYKKGRSRTTHQISNKSPSKSKIEHLSERLRTRTDRRASIRGHDRGSRRRRRTRGNELGVLWWTCHMKKGHFWGLLSKCPKREFKRAQIMVFGNRPPNRLGVFWVRGGNLACSIRALLDMAVHVRPDC